MVFRLLAYSLPATSLQIRKGGQLAYEWNFGDSSPLSNVANPSHTFIKNDGTPGMFTVTLKVTDPAGAEEVTTLVISINNTPPDVEITSPLNNALYPLTGETLYSLRATVTDEEHSAGQLTYRWQTTMHHESHEHPEPPDNQPETSTSLAPVGCDGENYFYTVTLTVTDAAGAATTEQVRLYPDCSSIVKVDPLITWPNPAEITQGTALGFSQLNATVSYNGSPVAGSFEYTPAFGTLLSLGTGQTLSVTFTPVNTVLYNAASKTVTIDVVASPPTTFYRALNLNGAALTIDGNSWQSSIGAANFSFTQAGGGVFAAQNVPLIPTTDANRATMIRSSIWGNAVNINLTSVPNGTYDVYIYVWEDNFTQTYSVSVEGSVVVPEYNSGTGGTWSKLGPFRTVITDGAVNVSANGGHACVSGIELWTAGPPPPNQPPVVASPIVDQNATVGLAYNYVLPANTFSDPNAGTTLTYTATLEGGGALPGWLTFTGTTRTFSGTPLLANLGAINISVTASDGSPGGTVSDVFTLTVSEAVKVTPVITWANPSPIGVGTALGAVQLNATASFNGSAVAGQFVYTPPSGTILSLGTGQELSVNFTPTNPMLYNAATRTVTIDVVESLPTTFYRALNLNGAALTIDGNSWQSSTGAANFSFTQVGGGVFAAQNVPLIPTTDANRATMIRSSVWGNTVNVNVTAVPNGSYDVYVYVWEDNFTQTYSISLEGTVVFPGLRQWTWRHME